MIRKVKIRELSNAVTARHFLGIFGKSKAPSALDFSLQKMKQRLRLQQRQAKTRKYAVDTRVPPSPAPEGRAFAGRLPARAACIPSSSKQSDRPKTAAAPAAVSGRRVPRSGRFLSAEGKLASCLLAGFSDVHFFAADPQSRILLRLLRGHSAAHTPQRQRRGRPARLSATKPWSPHGESASRRELRRRWPEFNGDGPTVHADAASPETRLSGDQRMKCCERRLAGTTPAPRGARSAVADSALMGTAEAEEAGLGCSPNAISRPWPLP